jgi:hypothetical protein
MHAMQRLQRAMIEEHAYRSEGLTVASLATRLVSRSTLFDDHLISLIDGSLA